MQQRLGLDPRQPGEHGVLSDHPKGGHEQLRGAFLDWLVRVERGRDLRKAAATLAHGQCVQQLLAATEPAVYGHPPHSGPGCDVVHGQMSGTRCRHQRQRCVERPL